MSQKGYLGIVQKLHSHIRQHQLNPGDKLPSERTLSELLGVGRSAVREGLRSLELLGLIETRRGEGTYLCNPSEHQLIEIIGTFILTEEKSLHDLVELKLHLEKSALEMICSRLISTERNDLSKTIQDIIETQKNGHDAHVMMFREIFMATKNQLMSKIWILVTEYTRTAMDEDYSFQKEKYHQLLSALEQGNIDEAHRNYLECCESI